MRRYAKLYIQHILIFLTLFHFAVLPADVYSQIIHVRNFAHHMHIDCSQESHKFLLQF